MSSDHVVQITTSGAAGRQYVAQDLRIAATRIDERRSSEVSSTRAILGHENCLAAVKRPIHTFSASQLTLSAGHLASPPR